MVVVQLADRVYLLLTRKNNCWWLFPRRNVIIKWPNQLVSPLSLINGLQTQLEPNTLRYSAMCKQTPDLLMRMVLTETELVLRLAIINRLSRLRLTRLDLCENKMKIETSLYRRCFYVLPWQEKGKGKHYKTLIGETLY